MKDFKTKILEYFNLTKEQYDVLSKDVTIDDLPSFKNYKQIEECACFIHEKVNQKTKILIYGDYDCDGVMSTSILYLTLKTKDFTPGFYIPFRETDGYGLTKNNIDKFKELGYKLIILVDNGINLITEINYANSLGIEIVILDHHTIEGNLPNAKFILHPTYSGFSKINMSAGTVAFFFSVAYLGFVDEYLLSMAAISTLSDLMPLQDTNRLLVKLGLKMTNKNKYQNIFLLNSSNSVPFINEKDISMVIIPKINAIGRLINNSLLFNIVRYFTNIGDDKFILRQSKWINDVNNNRKQLVTDLVKNCQIDNNKNSIVIYEGDIKEGLAGLLATRFMDEFNKPTAVIVQEANNPEVLKGSLRSKKGFNVNIILNDMKDILLTHGGHENAGGLTLKKENFNLFKERFEKAAASHPFSNEKHDEIDINLGDLTKENYDFLYALSPFGQDFKAPKFIIKNIKTSFLKLSKNRQHIYTPININSTIVYFNYDKTLFNYPFVDLIGELNLNYFNNFYSVQFKVLMFSKNL